MRKEEEEIYYWNRYMKKYLFERRVNYTNLNKTPEDMMEEEVDRLMDLEEKCVSRMTGEFKDDDLSKASYDDDDNSGKRKKKKKNNVAYKGRRNPDDLESNGEEDNERREEGWDMEARFTADGLF